MPKTTLFRTHFVTPGGLLMIATAWFLAATEPAGAMEDAVAGRWVSRDPWTYDSSSLNRDRATSIIGNSGSVAAIDSPNIDGPEKSSEYEFGKSRVTLGKDPTGLCCCFTEGIWDGVCVTVANPHGHCSGTISLGGIEYQLSGELQLMFPDGITSDCAHCSAKCLPFPILVIVPVQRDYPWTRTFMGFQITITMHCTLDGGWAIVWTCCKPPQP